MCRPDDFPPYAGTAPVGDPEDLAHFLMDKVELAIDAAASDEAMRLMREAITAYTAIRNPIAYANAANRQARLADRLNVLYDCDHGILSDCPHYS